ncbi:TPA: hypothetical protein ACNB05_004403, partial [Escherichia coli]
LIGINLGSGVCNKLSATKICSICDISNKTRFVMWIACFLIWYNRYKGIQKSKEILQRKTAIT